MNTEALTAIITKFSTYPDNLKIIDKDLSKAASVFAKNVVVHPEIFEFSKANNYYTWTLKPEIKNKSLPVFLKRYYADFYEENTPEYETHCAPVLDFLTTNPSKKQIEEWLEENDSEAFKIDDNERVSWLVNNERVSCSISLIRLSIEEAILCRQFEKHLNFFQKTLRRAYSDHLLGGCLVVMA